MALKLLSIGLVAGLFSALFGVGGGIVIVPLLILLLGFESRLATGTSLAAIGITALAGTILYAFEGHVDVAHAALVGLPAAAGAVAGTGLQQRVSGRALTLAFAGAARGARRLAARLMSASTIVFAVGLGFAAGVLAGLFGVGGGILFVPTLVALGLPQLDAEATSLLAILPTVAAGAWRQRRYGNVRWRTALVLGLASIAGAAAGVQIATALPEDVLRRLFAVLLLGVAAQLAWRSRRAVPVSFRAMSEHDEIWLPLVDEPIGSIVAQIQADDPEIERLVGSPRRILAFRTFAYIRVGVKLGELLVDNDVPPYDGTDNWIELLLRAPENRDAIAREVRAVAEEIAADPRYGEDEQLGPDQAARDRFRDFARGLPLSAWAGRGRPRRGARTSRLLTQAAGRVSDAEPLPCLVWSSPTARNSILSL